MINNYLQKKLKELFIRKNIDLPARVMVIIWPCFTEIGRLFAKLVVKDVGNVKFVGETGTAEVSYTLEVNVQLIFDLLFRKTELFDETAREIQLVLQLL